MSARKAADMLADEMGAIEVFGPGHAIRVLDTAAGSGRWLKDEDGTLLVPVPEEEVIETLRPGGWRVKVAHPGARWINGGWWMPVPVEVPDA